VIDLVGPEILIHELSRIADFFTVKKDKGGSQVTTSALPPKAAAVDILAKGEWSFPPLEGIVETPVLRPNGSVLTTPGYDAKTCLMYRPAPGLSVPEVPDQPTTRQVQDAVALIEDALCDFPFVDESSHANAWAAFLTPILRPALGDELAPAALVDAPSKGTGKGLLTSIISIATTGRIPSMEGALKEDDEWDKRITTSLRAGTTFIVIDNIEGRIAAPSLSRALTAKVWKARILRTNDEVHLPVLLQIMGLAG
jgi:putative DNA primase/helicase